MRCGLRTTWFFVGPTAFAWPDDAIEQLRALRAAITDRTGTVEAIARRFHGARRAEVEKHLEAVEVLGVVAGDGEGKWVVHERYGSAAERDDRSESSPDSNVSREATA